MPILLISSTQYFEHLHNGLMPSAGVVMRKYFSSVWRDSQLIISSRYLEITSVLTAEILTNPPYLKLIPLYELVYDRE